MPKVFKPTIIRYQMPNGTTRLPGGGRVNKNTPGAVRVKTESPVWWGKYKDEDGKWQKKALSKSKTEAKVMLEEMGQDHRKKQLGIAPPTAPTDPYAEHMSRPLTEHLKDYASALRTGERTPQHIGLTESRIQALFTGCGFVTPADLDPVKASAWLGKLHATGNAPVLPPYKDVFTQKEAAAVLGIGAQSVGKTVGRLQLEATGIGKSRRYPRATIQAIADRQARGGSLETVNHYVRAVRAFLRWMVKITRLRYNPLSSLSVVNTATDRRHDRRVIPGADLSRLLEATRASDWTFRGLTGEDRFMLYTMACGSGFRASALASLTPASFRLDAETPHVILAARRNKSRKVRQQPLPADVVSLLRVYLAGRPETTPLWPGPWSKRAAEMLRTDLATVGIPYTVAGPDGPLFADFHALRHSYITALANGGVDLATAQELAGHSTPVLTKRYTHKELGDLAKGVVKLPEFLPQGAVGSVKASGTTLGQRQGEEFVTP